MILSQTLPSKFRSSQSVWASNSIVDCSQCFQRNLIWRSLKDLQLSRPPHLPRPSFCPICPMCPPPLSELEESQRAMEPCQAHTAAVACPKGRNPPWRDQYGSVVNPLECSCGPRPIWHSKAEHWKRLNDSDWRSASKCFAPEKSAQAAVKYPQVDLPVLWQFWLPNVQKHRHQCWKAES